MIMYDIEKVKWTVPCSSVMFLVLHIFMFLFIYATQRNSVDSKDTYKIKDVFQGKANGIILKSKDGTEKDVTSFTTPRQLFHIIQNLTSTKAPNLKSNVFDKMLSDEILSIKKHFYEKDQSTVLVTKASTNNVPTPTLEVKQNWPMIGFIKQPNYQKHEQTLETNNSTKFDNDIQEQETKENNKKSEDENIERSYKIANEKVLGLRSLPEAVTHSHSHLSHQNQRDRMCTCIKTNSPGRCTHRCTSTNACSHTTSQCTSCTQTYSPIYFATVQPYFVGVTTLFPYLNSYYHPDVINPLKLPRKTKRRKANKGYTDKDLYYDMDYSTESLSRNENVDEYVYNYKHANKHKRVYDSEEAQDDIEDDEIHNEKTNGNKINGQLEYDKDQESLVQNIFDDLKTHYSESVVKDCYCSRWISSSPSRNPSFVICLQSLIVLMIANWPNK